MSLPSEAVSSGFESESKVRMVLTLRQEKLLTLFLSMIQLTCVMDFVIMMPLGPQFMRVFLIGPSEFSWMVSAYTFSAGVSGFVGALFIDRYDRKRALLGIYGGFTIATLLCALAPDHHFFVFARMAAGAFGGIMGAIVFSIIGDMIPEKRRGAATGRVMSAFALSSIIGIPFGLKLANIWSWRSPFFLLTGLSAVLIVMGYFVLPNMRGHLSKKIMHGRIKQTIKILTNPNHVRAYLLSGMIMIGAFAVIPFISPYVVANTGFDEADLMYIYLFGGCFTFFTSPLIGRLSDKFGKYRIFLIMAFLSIFPIVFLTHLGVSPFWVVILTTTSYMITSNGRMVPAVALITSSAHSYERGGFMSINSAVQQFSSGVAAFMAGHMIEKSASGALLYFENVGYISVATTILCLWLGSRLRPARSHASV